MPGKTQGDRLLDLEQTVAGLNIRSHVLTEELKLSKAAHAAAVAELAQLRQEAAVFRQQVEELRRLVATAGAAELAVLQEKVAKLESSREKAGARAWAVVPNISGAVVSGVIAAAVAFLVARYGK